MKTRAKRCKSCNKIMKPQKPRKRFCDPCLIERTRESKRLSEAKRRLRLKSKNMAPMPDLGTGYLGPHPIRNDRGKIDFKMEAEEIKLELKRLGLR